MQLLLPNKANVRRIGRGVRDDMLNCEALCSKTGQHGNATRVIDMGMGQNNQRDLSILDPLVYQNAFEKIDTAIFVRAGEKPPELSITPGIQPAMSPAICSMVN